MDVKPVEHILSTITHGVQSKQFVHSVADCCWLHILHANQSRKCVIMKMETNMAPAKKQSGA